MNVLYITSYNTAFDANYNLCVCDKHILSSHDCYSNSKCKLWVSISVKFLFKIMITHSIYKESANLVKFPMEMLLEWMISFCILTIELLNQVIRYYRRKVSIWMETFISCRYANKISRKTQWSFICVINNNWKLAIEIENQICRDQRVNELCCAVAQFVQCFPRIFYSHSWRIL